MEVWSASYPLPRLAWPYLVVHLPVMHRVYELDPCGLCSSAPSTEGRLDRFHIYGRGSRAVWVRQNASRVRIAVNNAILTQHTPLSVGSVGHQYTFHSGDSFASASTLRLCQTCPLADLSEKHAQLMSTKICSEHQWVQRRPKGDTVMTIKISVVLTHHRPHRVEQ